MGIIFPLITFPYASKALGVENIGKYTYAHSIINYFVLFAGLGISTYAIREGARIRNDEKKIETFASQMFSLNIATSVLSYAVLILLIIFVPGFGSYKVLLLILSLQIIFKTFGVEWIFSIYEDYFYITVRSIAFQVISLIAMFIFVKDEKSLYAYAFVTILGSVGTGVMNLAYSKNYVKLHLTAKGPWKAHLKPIIVLFSLSLATTIYVSSDATMLGIMCGDYTTGIYAVPSRIYSILKTLLSSVLIVAIPHLSALLGNKEREKFNTVAQDVLETLLTFVFPAVTGIILLRKEVVLLISGEEFLPATTPLIFLSVALVFCCCAWFWSQCILVPNKKENIVLLATILSALLNVAINLVCIPVWEENAAAFSTLAAESVSFIICYICGRKELKMSGFINTVFKILAGCIAIIIYILILNSFTMGYWLKLIFAITGSVILYFIIEISVKNNAVVSVLRKLLEKFGIRKIQG